MSGRRGPGFITQLLDESLNVPLLTLVVCNHMPEDRSEIPAPEAAKHDSILKPIPELDPDAQILLLLGQDVL